MKSCKMIYSFQYPKVREVAQKLWDSHPHYLFDQSYLKKQEGKEVEFFENWKKWTSPVVVHNESLSYFYPTNGSSEAIREIIYQLKNRKQQMVVVENDYEGYKAFAQACDLDVVTLKKEELLTFEFLENQTLVFSHPSSLDGNLYSDYDRLMSRISKEFPKTSVYVDLCYVGTVAKKYQIDLNYSCIAGYFMSLSKVFGVYYHRIGGLVSKTPEPGLYGNQWFKNMFSLQLGIELMKEFTVQQLPQEAEPLQQKLCDELKSELHATLYPSDVVILAHSLNQISGYERGNISRICLTPGLDLKMRK